MASDKPDEKHPDTPSKPEPEAPKQTVNQEAQKDAAREREESGGYD
jgi:hypothetical protein